MPKLRVHNFAISLDGYGAGPDQTLAHPLGAGGLALHEWALATRTFQRMHGGSGGASGVDDDFMARGIEGIGAWIIGRNMFGPIRGSWGDKTWKGWWGDNPPYHSPVFVVTHHEREPIVMEGGTEFQFITGGIHDALQHALGAARGGDVRLGGGVSMIRQYLQARLIDVMHLAVVPVVLGSGEHLLKDIDLRALGYDVAEHASSQGALHVVLRKRG